VHVLDRQRVHVDQDRRLQRLQQVVRAVAVVKAGLIALEVAPVNRSFTTPASLLRRARSRRRSSRIRYCCSHRQNELWSLIEVEDGEDTGHLVEIILSLAEALFQFDTKQDQRDLRPLGVPAHALRRGGYGL